MALTKVRTLVGARTVALMLAISSTGGVVAAAAAAPRVSPSIGVGVSITRTAPQKILVMPISAATNNTTAATA